ncbi:aldose 1-epimerase [Brevundimonas sp. FT23028]|uniref:aldose 1-epimerase n=1 Tax=Brevundimonas sp. FT23028 TaxID=3393748 RepID=UPI003B589820
MIELRRGGWSLILRPEIGGAVSALTRDGVDVLRRMPDGSTDVLEAACFPLTPWANRIAGGRFTFQGRGIDLPVLPAFAPHALHGDGWMSAWSVEAQNETSVTLLHRHQPDGWPWAYEARQVFSLTGEGLHVALSMTNLSDSAMPAGLGLHPYFPVSPDTRLTFKASQVWGGGEDEVPTSLLPVSAVQDWAAGPRVADAPFVDHAYVGSGPAVLTDGDRTTTVTASANAGWRHIYAPGADFCCIEPVTHRPDAAHAPADEASGWAVLAPGAALSMEMKITVG